MSQVRLAFIGTGGIAATHARRLQQVEEAIIVALADPNEAGRRAFAERFTLNDAAHYADYKDMLRESAPDAVIICSPHTLHMEQAAAVLESGAHVLIEKPMACSGDEARQLIAIAERTGKVLQVSYQRHFNPAFMYIQEAIAAGRIGKLVSITASMYQNWGDHSTGTWRHNPALSGGGMLMDSGSHIVDMLLWTTGLTPVEAQAAILNCDKPVEIDSYSTIRFQEGAVASLNVIGSAKIHSMYEAYVFGGTEGTLLYTNGEVSFGKPDERFVKVKLPAEQHNADSSFIDAVLGRCEVQVPGLFALKVVELTEMIYRAGGYDPRA